MTASKEELSSDARQSGSDLNNADNLLAALLEASNTEVGTEDLVYVYKRKEEAPQEASSQDNDTEHIGQPLRRTDSLTCNTK